MNMQEKLEFILEDCGWERIPHTSKDYSSWTNNDGWTIDLHSDFIWIVSPYLITNYDYDKIDFVTEDTIVVDLETIIYLDLNRKVTIGKEIEK